MKIAYSPYELRFHSPMGRSGGAVRRGALLRIEHEDLGIGYADCHPWPELGDEPLERQLSLLSRGEATELTRRSLAFARTDAEFRARGKSVFSAAIPESHVLAGNALELTFPELGRWAEEGFRFIKVKAGRSPVKEARHLRALSEAAVDRGLRLRIDLNEQLAPEEAFPFFDTLCSGEGARAVDFVEDPIPFQTEDWRSLKERFPLRLALDRGALRLLTLRDLEESADLLVLKPALQDSAPAIESLAGSRAHLVITSYLDHPLGTAGAAWHAARAREKLGDRLEACGLMTHLGYEETPFSRRIERRGSRWGSPEGTGFGFDEELRALEWKRLP